MNSANSGKLINSLKHELGLIVKVLTITCVLMVQWKQMLVYASRGRGIEYTCRFIRIHRGNIRTEFNEFCNWTANPDLIVDSDGHYKSVPQWGIKPWSSDVRWHSTVCRNIATYTSNKITDYLLSVIYDRWQFKTENLECLLMVIMLPARLNTCMYAMVRELTWQCECYIIKGCLSGYHHACLKSAIAQVNRQPQFLLHQIHDSTFLSAGKGISFSANKCHRKLKLPTAKVAGRVWIRFIACLVPNISFDKKGYVWNFVSSVLHISHYNTDSCWSLFKQFNSQIFSTVSSEIIWEAGMTKTI